MPFSNHPVTTFGSQTPDIQHPTSINQTSVIGHQNTTSQTSPHPVTRQPYIKHLLIQHSVTKTGYPGIGHRSPNTQPLSPFLTPTFPGLHPPGIRIRWMTIISMFFGVRRFYQNLSPKLSAIGQTIPSFWTGSEFITVGNLNVPPFHIGSK